MYGEGNAKIFLGRLTLRLFYLRIHMIMWKKCDVCQMYARNDLRMKMSLHVSLPLVHFKKWRIDYVKEIHPYFSKAMAYIVVAIEYLTK
jgi:hypothetical protein